MSHTYANIILHLVFSTRDRQNLLFHDMRSRLLDYMTGIASQERVRVLAANAVEDHLHMLVALPPVCPLSGFVRVLKANSSRWIHETFPDLREFAWQGGYGAFSVSQSAIPEVSSYIRQQGEHHRRMPFAEELRHFLERNQIPYDPEHYLD